MKVLITAFPLLEDGAKIGDRITTIEASTFPAACEELARVLAFDAGQHVGDHNTAWDVTVELRP